MDMCAVRLAWWKLSKYATKHYLSDYLNYFLCSFGKDSVWIAQIMKELHIIRQKIEFVVSFMSVVNINVVAHTD